MQVKGAPKAKPDEEDILSTFAARAMVAAGLFKINPVTKTGQRLYMVHMLLLPFLPITALIIQNSTTLNELLQYQTEVQRIGEKVKLNILNFLLYKYRGRLHI